MFHPSRSNSLRVWLKQMLHWTHQCLSFSGKMIELIDDFHCHQIAAVSFWDFRCFWIDCLLSFAMDSWVLIIWEVVYFFDVRNHGFLKEKTLASEIWIHLGNSLRIHATICYQGCHHQHQWTVVDTEFWSRTLEIERKFRTWGIWVGFLATTQKKGGRIVFFGLGWLIFVDVHEKGKGKTSWMAKLDGEVYIQVGRNRVFPPDVFF